MIFSGREITNNMVSSNEDCYIYPNVTRFIKTGTYVKVPEGKVLTALSCCNLYVHSTVLKDEIILKVTNMGERSIKLVCGMAIGRLVAMDDVTFVRGEVSIKKPHFTQAQRCIGGKEC